MYEDGSYKIEVFENGYGYHRFEGKNFKEDLPEEFGREISAIMDIRYTYHLKIKAKRKVEKKLRKQERLKEKQKENVIMTIQNDPNSKVILAVRDLSQRI